MDYRKSSCVKGNDVWVKFLYVIVSITFTVFITSSFVPNVYAATENKFYKGAVVEFSPDKWNGFERPEELLLRNARRFVTVIEEAGKENCDVIVFPEAALTSLSIPIVREKMFPFLTYVPSVEENSVPCKDSKIAEHLRVISCAAIKKNMYVLINLEEKQKCNTGQTGCPGDGHLFYNTNVVFDRTGKIIAKYHKFNLFREPEINQTTSAELITFETDFGVTFGTFTCFDVLFTEPSYKIIEEKQVRNILYPTAWFSELPFLTATQAQSGYSYLTNTNFLASGYSQPHFMNGGSGIYSGAKGPLVSVMPEEATTKLLIAKISKDPNYHRVSKLQCDDKLLSCTSPDTKIVNINFKGDFKDDKVGLNFFHEDLSDFTTELLETNEINENQELKQTFTYKKDTFNCEIEIKWAKDKEYSSRGPVYRFIGYSGERSYVGIRTVKIEVCGLIACQSENIKTCGYRPDFIIGSLTNITSILINTTTRYISNPLPSTLDKNILALPGLDMSFTNEINKQSGIQSNFMVLEKPHSDLISFGIYKS